MEPNKPNFPVRWTDFPRPIVCLAPMDGYTDSPFRRVVRQVNPQVVLFSEFTNAEGFLRSGKLRQKLAFVADEQPYFVQLFGNQPETFAEAARVLAQQGVTGIDINMGCPAKKIVSSQHGSGLMRDADTACRIVEAVAQATGLAVSVKTRLGWSDSRNLVPFAQGLASAGATLITIHGRTYDQAFHGQADWAPIYHLKTQLGVAVLGNGDVQNLGHGMARLNNLDGFMIGRAAIGDPWVFRAPDAAPPAWNQKVDLILQHYHWLREIKPEALAVREFRKHLAGYAKGFAQARRLRQQLLLAPDEATLLRGIQAMRWLDAPSDLTASGVPEALAG